MLFMKILLKKNQNKKGRHNTINHIGGECYKAKSEGRFLKLFLIIFKLIILSLK